MITLTHFIGIALRNLRRSDQRLFVALLCIIFGIMSLVAMTLVAKSIESSILVKPAELVGGDLSMVRENGNVVQPSDIEQLDALQRVGVISQYTLIAYNNSSLMFRTPMFGELHFVGNGMGIEPEKYPLAGSLAIGEPGSIGLSTLLQQVGDVIVTRDIAETYDLKVGTPLVLVDSRIGFPVKSIVRGIAYDTPNHQGDKIYYSLATAQKLSNSQAVVNTVIANTSNGKIAYDKLSSIGWAVDWVEQRLAGSPANMWIIGLRSAGILGLLVSGIGIANTMQVLLRRRQREMAIWKTLGYRERDLRQIFSLEVGLLGFIGSVIGAGLGIVTSAGVLNAFRYTSSVLYQWKFSPVPPLMGIAVGTLTTVIFAFWAIIMVGQVKPMALLRNEPANVKSLAGCQSILLGLLLAVPFTLMAGVIMESIPAGIGVLVCIVIGISVIGCLFSGVLWVCTRIFPLRRLPLVRIAINSLRRRGFALVFAMIALFIGIVSMSMGLFVTQITQTKISGHSGDFEGYNLTITATANQDSAVRQAVEAQHPQKSSVGYLTSLNMISIVGSEQPVTNMDSVLVGRTDPHDYVISGADWDSQPDGVYVYKGANLKTGSQVKIAFRDGTTKTLTVVGSYDINYREITIEPPIGLLIPAKTFTQIARPDLSTYFAQIDPDQVSDAALTLTSALPDVVVIDLIAYAGRYMQIYHKLYILPMVMAGLALLAGLLLIANSVSLAVFDRRYETGILKAVGYSRRQILNIFMIEYGVVGLLSTISGVVVIDSLLAALAIGNHVPVVLLLLNFPSLLVLIFCGVGLTLLIVCGVSWSPTRVSPVVVLNARS